MVKKMITQGLVDFLKGVRDDHPGKDLLDRYLEYGTDLETQVNVAVDDNEPVDGTKATWDTGLYKYWNVRIPKDAKGDANFKDYPITWPFEKHAEGVGTTGWHWKDHVSLFVGFDYDTITGHAKGVGYSKAQLNQVEAAARALPYVEVRKSTGGNGIHLYVMLDKISTQNHTEHAALARCVLGLMTEATGFDFARQVDACGKIMWFWHRKLQNGKGGLALIKPATRVLKESDLPANWRDHVEVITHRRTKVRVSGINEEAEDPFDALASARRVIKLDDTHKAVVDCLSDSGFSTVWINDHHLLQTHTCAFQNVTQDEEFCKKHGIKGFFITNSQGRHPSSPNCFAFPISHGGWKVYRFSQGVNEDSTWEQDGEGWTTCMFNHHPNLTTAARALGGSELSEHRGFQFDSAKQALEVARSLGSTDIELDDKFLFREAVIRPNKDGRVLVRVKKEAEEKKPGVGWANIRGGYWEKVFTVRAEKKTEEGTVPQYDERLRKLNTSEGESVGWFIKDSNKNWARGPASDAKMWLQKFGHEKGECDPILGGCIDDPWQLVHHPFKAEYMGDRQWNHNAPQYAHKVPETIDTEIPHHPHWDMVLGHCFSNLDADIKKLEWAKESKILTGADYGRMWISCCFRDPFEPLPFLFFFGSPDCGKSIFHEAISLLVTHGVASAERSLTNASGFNGELANAVVAYIEESDISNSTHAHARIKEWLTAKFLWIRKMRMDAYKQPNTLHMVMMANEQKNCPVYPGDKRITVISVPDLPDGKEIPKKILLALLRDEAAHFLYTLEHLTLPPVQGRLRLPVVETAQKAASESMNRSPIEAFIHEECFPAAENKVLFTEFYGKYIEWLTPDLRYSWTKQKVSRLIPVEFPLLTGANNKRWLHNLSMTPNKSEIKLLPEIQGRVN